MKCILLLTVFLVGIEYTISFRYKRISNSCSALYGKRLEIIVPDSQLKERIDVYLSGSFKEYSRSFISNLCDENSILVNGKPQSKNYKVRKGDSISFTVEEREVSSVAPEKIPIDILYEDDNIIAVNKAVGMVVHPAVGSPNGTFVNALLYHLGEGLATKLIAESEVYSKTKLSQKFEKDNSIEGLEIALDSENEYAFAEDGYEEDEEDEDEDGENYYLDVSSFPDDFDDLEEEEGEISVNSEFNKVSLSVGNNTNVVTPDLPETPEAAVASHVSLRPGIVHRLDKGTSGVLMAGKSADAVGKLSSVFALRKVRKVYVAVCVGHPGEATIVNSIGRSKKNRQLMEIYDGPPGKTAISHVKTLAFDGKLSVCLVRIETGR